MFLAEDRILCFELVAKAGAKWTLTYVKASQAETDVPEQVAEFISQRRRWLNGSFAASIYSMVHFPRIYRSNHNVFRMFIFHVQLLYNVFSAVFSWFALANLWLTFSVVVQLTSQQQPFMDIFNCNTCHAIQSGVSSGTILFDGSSHNITGLASTSSNTTVDSFFFNNHNYTSADLLGQSTICVCGTDVFNLILQYVYLGALLLSFLLALGQRPKGSIKTYTGAICVFAFCQVYLLACSFYLAIHALMTVTSFKDFMSGFFVATSTNSSSGNGVIVVALASTFGLFFFSSFLYMDAWHMFHSFPQYLLMAPSYINILNVYSFCNTHDVSWGTKGSDKPEALPEIDAKKTTDQAAAIVEENEQEQSEIDLAFESTVKRALAPLAVETKKEARSLEDGYKAFRTRLIIAWIFTNILIILAFTSTDIQTDFGIVESTKTRTAKYFAFILWSTAALSIIRCCGCVYFVLKTGVFRLPGLSKR